MLENNSLYNYFANNSRAKIKTYDNVDDLVKNAEDYMMIIDYEIYSYYQNTKFKDYTLIYKDTMMNDYKFMIKKSDTAFYNLFYYILIPY